MWNLKRNDTNELIEQKETHRLRDKYMVARGEGWGKGIARKFGMNKYTLLYLKWITKKDHRRAHGTLLSVMWQSRWEGSLGDNGYMYMYG